MWLRETSKYPRHVLRCSYTPADGSRNHDNDLAVICSKSASDSDHPFIGQVHLVSDLASEVNQGTLELYSGSAWGNVCYNGFDQTAADTACRQLGYTNAKSLSPSFKRSASTVWLDSVSCGYHSESQCLWHCLSKSAYKDLYDNKTKSCSGDSYVNVICDFEVSRRNATSPYVGNACQVPPYRGAGTSGWHPFATTHAGTDNSGNSNLGVAVLVGGILFTLVVLSVIVTCVAICLCCFVPSCYFYQQRTKMRYTRCSTSDKSSTDI